MLKFLTSARALWVAAIALAVLPALCIGLVERIIQTSGGDVDLLITPWLEDDENAASLTDDSPKALPAAHSDYRVPTANQPVNVQPKTLESDPPSIPTRAQIINRMRQMLSEPE